MFVESHIPEQIERPINVKKWVYSWVSLLTYCDKWKFGIQNLTSSMSSSYWSRISTTTKSLLLLYRVARFQFIDSRMNSSTVWDTWWDNFLKDFFWFLSFQSQISNIFSFVRIDNFLGLVGAVRNFRINCCTALKCKHIALWKLFFERSWKPFAYSSPHWKIVSIWNVRLSTGNIFF